MNLGQWKSLFLRIEFKFNSHFADLALIPNFSQLHTLICTIIYVSPQKGIFSLGQYGILDFTNSSLVTKCALELGIIQGIYLVRASSLVPLSFMASYFPVLRFTIETGFFNNPLPTLKRFSRFSFVDISVEETAPLNVSSYHSSKELL